MRALHPYKKKKIFLLIIILLFTVFDLAAADTIVTYVATTPVFFDEFDNHPKGNGGPIMAAKISRLTIQFTGGFANNSVQIQMQPTPGKSATLMVYEVDGWGSAGGMIFYHAIFNNVPIPIAGATSNDLNASGIQNILPTNTQLMNTTLIIDFYIYCHDNNFIKPGKQYRIDGLPDMGIAVGTTNKPGQTIDPKDQIDFGGLDPDNDGSIDLIPDAISTGDALDDVPVGPPAKEPTPQILIDAVSNPLLNRDQSVKIADLKGYWEDSTATKAATVSINIKPFSGNVFELKHESIANTVIPYALYYANNITPIPGTGTTYNEDLSALHTANNKALFGSLSAKLDLLQTTLNSKPAGTYTDTIVITISIVE